MMISTQMPSQSFANNHPGAKPDSSQPSDRGMKCLAKALYDNVAEAPDELAFRKGDVLTVLEQNTNGLEGWWLCTLRGRQGIAPGNRLRLMPGVYDPAEPSGILSTDRGAIHSRRRSWQVSPNKVITPQKIGDVYVYDVPVGAMIIDAHEKSSFSNLPCRGCSSSCSYDTPPSPRLVGSHPAYDEPRPSSQQYDLPKPYLAYDQPRSHFSQQHNHSQLQSFRAPSKIVRPNDYDIPNADFEAYDVPGPPRAVDKRHLSENLISTKTNYDMPPTNHIGGCTGSSCSSALPSSQRSSGVSLMSSSSESSLNTSLSLSSICGSNRSSLEHQSQDMYDFPNPGEPRPVVPSDLLKLQSCCAASIAMPSPSAQCLNRNGCPNSPHNSSRPEPACKLYESPPVPRPAQTGALEGGVYDIPPQVSKDVTLSRPDENGTDFIRRFSSSSTDSREFRENFPDIEGKELPLDLDGAMERLVKLHEEVQSAISKLFSYVSATWRKKEDLEVKIPDIKSTCHKLCSVLQEFLSFVYGALANSTHSADKALCHKLGKLVMPLNDPNSTVQTATQALDDKAWEVSCLTRQKETDCPDELDQLVASARVLVEDVRQVASFIQGNCTLIFKRSQTLIERNLLSASTDYETFDPSDTGTCKNIQETPLPDVPYKPTLEETETTSKEHSSDYDYVNLESKESVERENEEIKASLPQQLHKSFDNLVKQSYVPVDNDMSKFPVIQPLDGNWSSSLSPSDLQVFKFYTIQFDNHLAFLTNAIDAFLLTIENNQPPKVFIGHSKFVVISAHKLVYIGDTVNRNISSSNLKAKVIQASNGLCDSLKALVSSTKKAALQFPSVVAVQEMIDSVVDVSHLASDLKTVLYDASKL